MKNVLHKLDEPMYVEEIFIKVPPERVEDWIQNDHKIWGDVLAECNGVYAKEIWVSKDVPGEIRAILYWNDYAAYTDPGNVELDARLDGKMMEALDGQIEVLEFRQRKNQYLKVYEYEK